MTTAPAILTRGLTKSYGPRDVVKQLNLSVKQNSITAFLGRNGAGKSTTLKMLLGMIRPTAGEGIVLGKRVSDIEENRAMRNRVSYVAESKPLYSYMTVEQTLRFASSFYKDWRSDEERQLLHDFELPPRAKVKSLSKGMRAKLALLLALARNPDLLILDEPTEGLDPVGAEFLLQALIGLSARGVTIFFSSHQIAEVERIADHVCILEQGCLLIDSSLDSLRQSYRRIDLVFRSDVPIIEFFLPGVKRTRATGRNISLIVSGNAEAVIGHARTLNAVSIDVTPVCLRDIFLETVRVN